MKLPESFTRGLSECDKQLADRVFEEARKQMLTKIKWFKTQTHDDSHGCFFCEGIISSCDWLEGELK